MRSDTKEIYQQKVNQVIDFINANLHQPLMLDKMADHIFVSGRQLLRIMRTALNEPLSAYVARQRIELAVMYMQTEKMCLTTLAEKVGYDNAQSFSKAFKKCFGQSPKAYLRELQARQMAYVKTGDNAQNHLQPVVCEENEMELVYIRIFGKYGDAEPYETAWSSLTRFMADNEALSETTRFIGISFSNPHVTKTEQCRYYACATTPKKITPKGAFGTISVNRGKYAVYMLKGSYSGLQGIYSQIGVNFPYSMRHAITFEEYLNSPQSAKEKDLLTKIYIPIN